MTHGLLSRSAQDFPAGPPAPVAQRTEREPSKLAVAGSIPAGGTAAEKQPYSGPAGSTIPVADARGEGSCGPGPMTALSGSGGTPVRDERSVRAGGLSASPVNVSPPPAAAPGQRWSFQLSNGWKGATIRPDGGLSWDCGAESLSAGGWSLKHVAHWQSEGKARYLGPTPTETPSPAHPPTAVPPPPPSPGRAAVGAGGHICDPLCGKPRSAWIRAKRLLSYLPIGHEKQADPIGWCCETKWNRGVGPAPAITKGDAVALLPDGTIVKAGGRRDASPVRPARPAGITCTRCLTTSEKGDAHREACPVMRESGPSAVAMVPARVRDTFADLVDDWDLLPEAGR